MKRAFTLIELLIVIAIIAILALIAIPNFVEAQNRSKVSRVMADMRSMGTAVEAYYVDYNAPPISNPEAAAYGFPGFGKDLYYRQFTTPVAYLTSIPTDPFIEQHEQWYWNPTATPDRPEYDVKRFLYRTYAWGLNTDFVGRPGWASYNAGARYGVIWSLYSPGPSAVLAGYVATYHPNTVQYIYDPTNGTISLGGIMRTNLGEYRIK